MSEKNDVVTNESEDKETPETTVNEEQEESTEAPAKETVGDLHDTSKSEKPKEVPIERLDKEIQKRKELEAELAELRKANDESDEDDSSDGDAKVAKLEKEIAAIKERDAMQAFEAKFKEHLDSALEEAPEFKDVVNPEVVKQMVLNPKNKDKTYAEILEDVYGNSVSGKRSAETATPRGGAENEKLDLQRTQRDAEYRKKVLADPELRKQYNEGIEHRINL